MNIETKAQILESLPFPACLCSLDSGSVDLANSRGQELLALPEGRQVVHGIFTQGFSLADEIVLLRELPRPGNRTDWFRIFLRKAGWAGDAQVLLVFEIVPDVQQQDEIGTSYRMKLKEIFENRVQEMRRTTGFFMVQAEEREKARQSADRAARFFLSMLEDFPVMVWKAGADGKCDFVNKAWLHFTGRSGEQELGEGWMDRIHPADKKAFKDSYLANFALRQPFEMEYRLQDREGVFHRMQNICKPFLDPEGQFGGYIGVLFDLTDLREYAERITLLLRMIPSAVYTVTPDRIISSWNQKAEEITGYKADEVIGLKCDMFALSPCAEHCGLFGPEKTGPVQGRECTIRAKNGKVLTILKNTEYMKDLDGKVVGGVESFEDITVRREIERLDKLRANVLGVLTKPWSLKEIVRKVVSLIKDYSGFSIVALRLKEGADYPYFVNDGHSEAFIGHANKLCKKSENGKCVLGCLCGDVIEERIPSNHPNFSDFGSFHTSDLPADLGSILEKRDASSPFYGDCLDEGIRSMLLIPLKSGDSVMGLLQFSDPRAGLVTPHFRLAMENLSLNIGISLAQKEAEKILRDSEEKFVRIFQCSPDMILITSLKDGQIREVNDSFLEKTGYVATEILGKSSVELGMWVDPGRRSQIVERILDGFPILMEEVQFRTKDGEARDYLLSAERMVVGGEEMLLSTMQDVTETKRQRELYATIFHQSAEGFWLLDRSGTVTDTNQAYLELVGKRKEDIVGKRIWKEVDSKPEVYEDFLRGVPSVKSLSFQTVQHGVGGARLDFEVTLQYLKEVNIVFVFLRNITERKKFEAQLIRSERRAAVGQLAAGVAHEFNNLLAIIKGNVALADPDRMTHAEIKESLAMIDKQVDRGKSITENIISFSRSQKAEKERVSIQNIINENYRFQRKEFDLHKVRFVLEAEGDFPVFVNRNQFRLVFIHLFSNAIHACIKGKPENPEVRVHISDEGEKVRVSIRDNGCGMDEQVRERIFTPFFSTKGGYATDGLHIPGRGLGLTIVSAILTEHRTSLDMESEPGKGTEIILHIPKEPGEDSDQGAFR